MIALGVWGLTTSVSPEPRLEVCSTRLNGRAGRTPSSARAVSPFTRARLMQEQDSPQLAADDSQSPSVAPAGTSYVAS